jgi:hypothetical protein
MLLPPYKGEKFYFEKKPNVGFGHLVKPLLSCCSVYQSDLGNSLIKVNFYGVVTQLKGASLCFMSIFPAQRFAIIFVNYQQYLHKTTRRQDKSGFH